MNSSPNPNQSHLDKLFNAITWPRIVVGALIFLLISLSFQAYSFLLKSGYQLSPVVKVIDYSQKPLKGLQLQLTYPTSVYVKETDVAHQPISVWLWTTEPVTSADAITYTVSFLYSDDDLFFTNKEGLPASAEVSLSPDTKRGEAGVIYVRQAKSTLWWFKWAALTTRVVHPKQPDSFLPGIHTAHIRLWPWWLIGAFEFLKMLFGPALTLASTAVIVIGFGVQQVLQRREKLAEKEIDRQQERERLEFEQKEKERAEREQQEREKLEQKLNEVKNIQNFLNTDPGKAVRCWWQYTQWASVLDGKPDWQKSELQDELNSIWLNEIKEIKNPGWQLALLIEAVGLFNTGEYQQAAKRARLIHEIDSTDKSVEAVAAQFLIAHMEEKRHQIVNVAKEVGPKKAVGAIWWLYNCKDGEFRSIVKPVVVRTLAELVGNTDTFKEAYKIFDNGGQHLLKEPEFGEALQKFLTRNYPSEILDMARQLQNKRQEKYRWPPLWPPWLEELQTDDETKVLDWLREVSGAIFNYNPFGPKRAELDPHFTKHFVYPTPLKLQTGSQRGIRPTILFGNSSSGLTATALLLAYDCQNSREKLPKNSPGGEIFPVYHSLQTTSFTESSSLYYLELIAQILGKYLIEFLILNPYSYLDHTDNQKYAIANLLTYIAGSTQNLEILLKQTQLSNDNAGRHLTKRLLEFSQNIPDGFEIDRNLLLEMLQHARPYGFDYTYILLDISMASSLNAFEAKRPKQLQPLLDLMLPLARINVYLKLFMPPPLKKDLFISGGITSDTINWTPEKLKELLKHRLDSAQPNKESRIDSLDKLFDRDARESNPTEMLIAASEHSPGRLIKLIDQLLKIQAGRKILRFIDFITLESVLKTTNDENTE